MTAPAENAAPPGWHTITPRIFTDDVAGLAAFMRHVFGATGEVPADRPAEMRIGDSHVMISGTDVREPLAAFLYLYLPDVDGVYARAVAAGAETIEAPRDLPYGDRRATVKDAWGNTWQIASRLG